MPEDSATTSAASPDEIEEAFFETLREVAFIFEKEENGRFRGPILACKTVARFIYQRGKGAELAGPFFQIAAAFEDLEKGGKPRLFSKKSTPEKERQRSPERRHIHMLAAAALEVIQKLGRHDRNRSDEVTSHRSVAAARIARGVSRWPGMEAQEVTPQTIIALRNQQRSLSKSARKPFDTVVAKILAEPDPGAAVDQLIQSGPPGYSKS
jgi:hypothetical protein